MIRLTVPSIEADDLEAVRHVVASGQLVQGPHVGRFESAIADVVGSKHAVVVTNCTAALQMALLAVGVGPGDTVVIGAYSWPTTANVVELCGAVPVFVDVDPESFNMRVDALEETLQRLHASPHAGRRVKAIIPIHVFGQIADMRGILAVAERFGIPVIEDAACALGASAEQRQAGSWGVMGCFSFHPRKAVTTGEGGAIVTNDETHARYLRALRNHGQDPVADQPDPFMFPGFNNRMTEFQAALGVSQMAKLGRIIAARRALAQRYDELLPSWLSRQGVPADDPRHVFQSYVVLLPTEVAPRRAAMISELRTAGIETQIGTWHMPLITYYRSRYGYQRGAFPVCDDIASRALTLPLYEGMTADDQRAVVEAVSAQVAHVAGR
ncbi:MAG: DegT/DnrJ/EryC1/StrS family aminotransferase [Gemmatimonadaceae bacterium]|nr:DegT/DnrJ/EryC1/StrS family aminotransferase [Gemmatimonadaceae bacterium]